MSRTDEQLREDERVREKEERRNKLFRIASCDIRNAIRCRSSQNKRRKIERKQR